MDDWGTPDSLDGTAGRRRDQSAGTGGDSGEPGRGTAPGTAPAAPRYGEMAAPEPKTDEEHASGIEPVEDVARARAVADLKKRREFHGLVQTWVSVSAITTGVWFASGADGSFWPIWPILGIGVGVATRAAKIWGPSGREITEAEIADRMRQAEDR